jgi:hypothetical protein
VAPQIHPFAHASSPITHLRLATLSTFWPQFSAHFSEQEDAQRQEERRQDAATGALAAGEGADGAAAAASKESAVQKKARGLWKKAGAAVTLVGGEKLGEMYVL